VPNERKGQNQEARELYERVLTGRRRALGDQHPDTAAARNAAEHLNDQLTSIFRDLGRVA
jgi:Tetratricopeptide repeat